MRTQLQETGEMFVPFGPSDDIGEVVDAIRLAAADIGLEDEEIRIDLSGPAWMLKVEVIR